MQIAISHGEAIRDYFWGSLKCDDSGREIEGIVEERQWVTLADT
jgi:hypothetical protein